MSKSVELLLKEALEANASQAKALTEKVEALATEGNTYTDRMKKMEDNLHAAMTQVLGMDASIKEFHKVMEGKLCGLEEKYAAISVQKDDADMEEGENAPETKDEDNVEVTKKPTDKAKGKKMATDKSKVKDEGAVGDGEKDEGTESETEEQIESPDVQQKEVEEGTEEHEGGKGKPHKSAENSIEGVNPTLNTVDKKTKMKKGAEMPAGKPAPKVVEEDGVTKIDEESNKKFTKGSKKAEEAVVEVKAEEIVPEIKAEEAPIQAQAEEVIAQPKAEETISTVAQALNQKIEHALEKLASVTAKPHAEVTQLTEKLALEAKAKDEALNHFKALNEKFEALMSKVSSLEKSEKTIEQKAAQIVSANGVEAVAISVDAPAVLAKTDSDVMKEFEALSGTEQRNFYLANKQAIERHASATLRGKRS